MSLCDRSVASGVENVPLIEELGNATSRGDDTTYTFAAYAKRNRRLIVVLATAEEEVREAEGSCLHLEDDLAFAGAGVSVVDQLENILGLAEALHLPCFHNL